MIKTEEQISLKEIILKFNEWFKFLLSKWILIILTGIIGASLGFLYAFLSKPTYTAAVSFVLQSDNNTNSLSGFASQFGIDLGGSNNNVFSGENIISLMNSQSMIKKILFRKADEDVLANMIVRELKLDKGWSSNERTSKAFPFPDDITKLTPVQDSLLREMYDIIIKQYIQVSRPDKNASIYIVNAKAKNEKIAYYLVNNVVNETTKFYIDTKTSVAKKNLQLIQKEADSLKALLSGTIASTASDFDKTYNLNPAFQSARSSSQEGQLRITALATAYGEVLKNLEIAKITLLRETPLYQVVDSPQLPLKADKPSVVIWFILGGMIGFFICVLFLLSKKIGKDIMA
jgi:uncharacterized protein involved in exopolysaccharide biosynthesis